MRRSYAYALFAAATFGVGIPFSKALLSRVDAVLLAGLLYLGAAVSTTVYRYIQRSTGTREVGEAPLRRRDLPWLTMGLVAGGVAAPLLLLFGLDRSEAGIASLLLSLEAVFTTALAVAFFAESISRRMFFGLIIITSAALLLATRGTSGWGLNVGVLAVAGATFCWGIDNNATGKVALKDPATIVGIKGLVAGTVNTLIAVGLGVNWPGWFNVLAGLGVGAVSYGLSLVLFIFALRGLGPARATALFGTAPFIGTALAAIMFDDSRSWVLAPTGVAVALGTWLLIRERHTHWHAHKTISHEHRHMHDEHHQHRHDADYGREPHSHVHKHMPLAHCHAHVPDAHHQHTG